MTSTDTSTDTIWYRISMNGNLNKTMADCKCREARDNPKGHRNQRSVDKQVVNDES